MKCELFTKLKFTTYKKMRHYLHKLWMRPQKILTKCTNIISEFQCMYCFLNTVKETCFVQEISL